MIDILEQAKEAYKKRILQFLAERAKKDPLVANGCKDENKNIDDCIKFVIEQARKQAVNNCAFIDDEEVFGWVVHYVTEPIEKKQAKKEVKQTSENKVEKTEKKEEKDVVKEKKKTIAEDLQLLFDFGG